MARERRGGAIFAWNTHVITSEPFAEAEPKIVGEILIPAAEDCVFDPPAFVESKAIEEIQGDTPDFTAQPDCHDVLVCIRV